MLDFPPLISEPAGRCLINLAGGHYIVRLCSLMVVSLRLCLVIWWFIFYATEAEWEIRHCGRTLRLTLHQMTRCWWGRHSHFRAFIRRFCPKRLNSYIHSYTDGVWMWLPCKMPTSTIRSSLGFSIKDTSTCRPGESNQQIGSANYQLRYSAFFWYWNQCFFCFFFIWLPIK